MTQRISAPVALASETRAHLPTRIAAQHLCVTQKTLRRQLAQGCAPVTPIRVGARLLWPTAALRQVLGL